MFRASEKAQFMAFRGITAIKKPATMKSMPYQTLIRHWLAEEIKKELELVER